MHKKLSGPLLAINNNIMVFNFPIITDIFKNLSFGLQRHLIVVPKKNWICFAPRYQSMNKTCVNVCLLSQGEREKR